MKDLPKNFTAKSQKCEIPKCFTKRYNFYDFLDKVTPVPDGTIRETRHEFTIRASEVNISEMSYLDLLNCYVCSQ